MNLPIIRRARKEDCPRLLELIKELADYEKAPEKVTVSLPHFEESGFGDAPVWWGFVVEVAGQIHGFALYYIRYSTWRGKMMYLEDLYVSEEKRRNELGTLLFDNLIKEAIEKKLHGIVWQVLSWNQIAIDFYKKYDAHFDDEWINCSIEMNVE